MPLLWMMLAGCGPEPGELDVWRFAIEESAGSVQDAYAQAFAERIAAETGGDVQVKVYPYGTLGTSDHITELVHNGSLQLATASPGHLGKIIPEVQALLLHHVLPADPEAAHEVLGSAEVTGLLQPLYRDKGFALLSVFSEGEMVWTTDREVRTPSDFEGLKMRVMTSPLLLAAYEAYGASPTPLPYGEVYSALQLGMVDGQVNPVFAIQEMSFYEVTDWMIFPGHAPFVTTVMANDAFLDGLSPERRALVDRVVAGLHDEIFAIQQQYNAERLETIRERRPDLHVVRLTAEERARFEAASAPVRERYLDMAGPAGPALLEALSRTPGP